MSESNIAIFKNKDYSNFNLTFPEVDELLDKIEIIKRRKIKDVNNQINYIDPLNHVKTLTNPVNHLIVGRRGSGKTSLMIKVIEEIRKKNGLVTIVDMQGKQSQSIELPLIEVLSCLFSDLKTQIENQNQWESYLARKTKIKYYKIKSFYYGLRNKNIWNNDIIEIDKIYNSVLSIIFKLHTIRNTPNDSKILISKSTNKKSHTNKAFKTIVAIGADAKYLSLVQASSEASYEITIDNETNSQDNIEYSGLYSKKQVLDELKQDITKCIEEYFLKFKQSIFLILDDFYQIPIDNQPYVFQYLHDINKETIGSAFSYKACLVPNRFKLNDERNKVLSHKDDFSTINLDREFCELEANKDLLFKILCSIDPKLNFTTAKINKLFNDVVVINDCIRASGALPRYFLDVFHHMVKYSKAENQLKIHKMVLSQVIREIKKSKDGLISEEAYLPDDQIRKLYSIIEEEIVHGLQTNVILYPHISFKENEDIMNTLINLGYIHRIKENLMVEKINYVPLFIDMIFTHTKSEKMPKNFKDVKFWEQNGKVLLKCNVWEFNKEKINELSKVTAN